MINSPRNSKNTNVSTGAFGMPINFDLLSGSHSEYSESFNRLYEGANKMLIDSMGQVNYHHLDMVKRV